MLANAQPIMRALFCLLLLRTLLSAATELHEAAATGNSIQISALLKAGASVSATDDNKLTPLHLAAAEGHVEAVKLLLGVGASLDAQDVAEQTPLHLAASQGESFVDWLGDNCPFNVTLARGNESLSRQGGQVLIAPPQQHMFPQHDLVYMLCVLNT